MRGSFSRRTAGPLLFVLSIYAGACAGDGGSDDAASTTSTTMGSGMGASLADIQNDIFTPACGFGGCHDSFTAAGNLDLSTAEASFDEMVGVTSLCGTAVRVVPGDSDASYLMDKLGDGASPCGTLMPLGAPQLSDGELAEIRSWIDAGANPALFAGFATTTTYPSASSSSTTSTTVLSAGSARF